MSVNLQKSLKDPFYEVIFLGTPGLQVLQDTISGTSVAVLASEVH